MWTKKAKDKSEIYANIKYMTNKIVIIKNRNGYATPKYKAEDLKRIVYAYYLF